MATITKVKVKSMKLQAEVKLDEGEALALIDQTKVENFILDTQLAPLSLEDLATRRDEEVESHITRQENGVDQRIDFERDHQ